MDRGLEVTFFNQNYLTKKTIQFLNPSPHFTHGRPQKIPDEALIAHAQGLYERKGHFTQFPRKNSKTKFIEYAVEMEDTIYGLEFKFNVR